MQSEITDLLTSMGPGQKLVQAVATRNDALDRSRISDPIAIGFLPPSIWLGCASRLGTKFTAALQWKTATRTTATQRE